MSSVFVFGTLRHVPLLEAVLGRAVPQEHLVQAVLPGHQVSAVKDEDFPLLTKGGDGAEGLLIHALSAEDVARLDFYEGGYDYHLTPCEVETAGGRVPALVYRSENENWTPEGLWSLSGFVDRFGLFTVLKAQEEMGYYGTYSRAEVDRMLPTIRARATAQVMAQVKNPAVSPGGMTRDDVSDVEVNCAYVDYFRMDELNLRFKRYDGSTSGMVRRAVFVATDAVIVLPYDPVRDRVMLVEQFRPGPYVRGDEKPWQLEPIAGRVDGAETPETTAHREAQEEAGLALKRLEEVATCYASPGASTEYYNIYLGLADLPDESAGVSGLEAEAEDIRAFLYSFDELMAMVDAGKLVNAPLVLAALWLARHRDRLRQEV